MVISLVPIAVQVDEYGATHHLDEAVRDRFDIIDERPGMTGDGGTLNKLIETAANRAWLADFLRRTLAAGVLLMRTRYCLTRPQYPHDSG